MHGILDTGGDRQRPTGPTLDFPLCRFTLGERFVLWAVRQWRVDRALPTEGSTLHRGFKTAGLLDALADFAIVMDAVQFGARRALCIHLPTCSAVSHDEATLVALCALAQGGCDRPLAASFGVLLEPAAARVAVDRCRGFAATLATAGLRLAPAPTEGAGHGRLN
ncbi:MAG: hypothetical protein U1E23_13255 [Reyranellaceae bacterium]